MTIKEREDLYSQIAQAMIRNYDEVTDHEEPYVSISLYEEKLPLPKCYTPTEDNEFVDELFASLPDLLEGFGVVLCMSNDDGECCERVDEIDIEDLDDNYLVRLANIVESHTGFHIGSENIDKYNKSRHE